MSLQLYLANRWIRRHEPTRAEIVALLAIADRDIQQSQTAGLVAEWRFDIAYNAALQLATACLAASGFRAERQSKHLRTLETLEFSAGLDQGVIGFLDVCRRKRHTAVYEQVGAVSSSDADGLISLVQDLRAAEGDWLRLEHPDLVESPDKPD